MKAVVYNRYGAPEQLNLEEIDKPIPKKDQVLIKVYASSINSWDWDLLKGNSFLIRVLGGLFKPKHKILGADVSGVIEAVGKDVKCFKPGDEVFGDIAGSGFGGFAEYAVTAENFITKKPAILSFKNAAALPQAGLLALQGLRYKKEIKPGDHLLINGAGGGVGPIALQYAKLLGAKVTCVDKEEKFGMLLALGADDTIDYRKEDYTRKNKQYDYILDVIAHRKVADYKRALKPDGVFAMIGGSMGGLLWQMMVIQPFLSLFRKQKLGVMGYRVNQDALNELSELFEQGKIIPAIDCCFPLQKTADAFRRFEEGLFKGKIIIAVSPDITPNSQF